MADVFRSTARIGFFSFSETIHNSDHSEYFIEFRIKTQLGLMESFQKYERENGMLKSDEEKFQVQYYVGKKAKSQKVRLLISVTSQRGQFFH